MEKDVETFIKKLQELSEIYGIYIDSSGFLINKQFDDIGQIDISDDHKYKVEML